MFIKLTKQIAYTLFSFGHEDFDQDCLEIHRSSPSNE